MKRSLTIFLCLATLLLNFSCSVSSNTSGGSGNLNVIGIDPYTLDPALASDSASIEYITQIFSGLVRLDDNMEPVPDIAQTWEKSDDGITYTFYLRQDVYFQDGRHVTASDFKYSWERAADPNTASETVKTYLGDIEGIDAVTSGKTKTISGVEIVDDYTLRLKLTGPRSYFLAKLSYVTADVVDHTNVETGTSWWKQPNGTGPFVLQTWSKGDNLILKRNDLYYGDKALLSSVTYKLLAGIPMNLYQSGDVDVAQIDSQYFDMVTDPAGAFVNELVITPQLSMDYILIDVTRPPFDDINVRKAFSMSLDKSKLAALIFRNTVSASAGILPLGIPGYNPYLIGLPFDVNQAKILLSSSRYADDMPTVAITVSGYGGLISREIESIVYDWNRYLGVEIRVRQIEPEEFFYNIHEERDNLISFAWNADYAHPQNFLEVLFGEGMPYNIGGYNSAEFNSILEQAASEQDEAKSLELYQQAEQVLVNDAGCIPLWSGESYILIKPYVHGYEPKPLGIVRLNTVWLDQ